MDGTPCSSLPTERHRSCSVAFRNSVQHQLLVNVSRGRRAAVQVSGTCSHTTSFARKARQNYYICRTLNKHLIWRMSSDKNRSTQWFQRLWQNRLVLNQDALYRPDRIIRYQHLLPDTDYSRAVLFCSRMHRCGAPFSTDEVSIKSALNRTEIFTKSETDALSIWWMLRFILQVIPPVCW